MRMSDGTDQPPRLRVELNYLTLVGMQGLSVLQRWTAHERVRDGGFEGVQIVTPGLGSAAICRDLGLSCTVSGTYGKLPLDGNLFGAIERWKDQGIEAATLLVGTGLETDDEADALVAFVLECAAQTDFPLYVETHRATVTQDIHRTLRLLERFETLRFCGDFSHWYFGHALARTDPELWLPLLEPVFRRTRYLQGRIATQYRIQADAAEDDVEAVHHRQMWTRCFQGFLRNAEPGDVMVFAPELLPVLHGYAEVVRSPEGHWEAQGDRWRQALRYAKWARACFEEARAGLDAPTPEPRHPVIEVFARPAVEDVGPSEAPEERDWWSGQLRLDVHVDTIPSDSPRAFAHAYRGVQVDDGSAPWERTRSTVRARLAALPDPATLAARAAAWQDQGFESAAVRLGTGFEDDDTVDAAVEALLRVQLDLRFPLYLETRRGTITQDLVRTLRMVHRFPDVRFCLDFSEWYAGHELVFGDVQDKLLYLEPVFARTRMMRGRVGTWECSRTHVGSGSTLPALSVVDNQVRMALRHHMVAWTRSIAGFRRSGSEVLAFVVDLPPTRGRTMLPDRDRWDQGVLLAQIARDCFDEARWQ